MRFTSKHAAQQVPIRDAVMDYTNNPNGRMVRPALWADFAEEAWTETYEHADMDGGREYTALAGGGHFDSVVAQARHNWTDDERVKVEEKLLSLCPNAPGNEGRPIDALARAAGYGDVMLHVPTVPTPPWPTYDDTHHFKVASFAEEAGLLEQALMYEERTKKRAGVMTALREKLEEKDAEKALTAA